jgi:small subunit ribosomal protein S20
MPITDSAKKALRQSVKRRLFNIEKKDKIKGLIKEIRALAANHKIEEAKKLIPKLYQALDKTAKKGTIKKNTASRKKSRLTILINKTAKEATTK